jgi:proteasome lid subunit RPN8/RPN11
LIYFSVYNEEDSISGKQGILLRIILGKPISKEIIQYCVEKIPTEACGIVYGISGSDNALYITGWQGISNIAENAENDFLFDPGEWIEALYGSSENAESIIGLFHSHPSSGPLPSPRDLQTDWANIPSHWIISLSDSGVPIIKAYQYKAGENEAVLYEEIPLQIAE